MRGQLRQTLYFDEEGINDLSDQVRPGRLEGFSIEAEESRNRSGRLTPKFGLGSLFKLFGGADIGVDADFRRNKAEKNRTSEEFIVTRADRLQRVIEQLRGVSALTMSLDRAWQSAIRNDGSIFCIINDLFRTMPTAEPEKWLEVANTSGYLRLTDASTCRFLVGMRLAKLSGVKDGQIDPTSHLAVRLGKEERHNARLTIFGAMDKSRYLKPFVVYWG